MLRSILLGGIAAVVASRSAHETVDLLQIGILAKELRTTAMSSDNLENLKSEVLNLAAAKVPDAAQGYLDSIFTLLRDQVMNTLKDEFTTDNATYNQQFALFATFAAGYTDALGALSTQQRDSLRGTHQACREQESILHGEHVTCSGQEETCLNEYTTARDHFNSAGSTLNMQSDEFCSAGSDSDRWLDATRNNFNAFGSKFDAARTKFNAYRDKKEECTGRSTNLTQKTSECDEAQQLYENEACSYAEDVNEKQIRYSEQYKSHREGFEIDAQNWATASADRLKQCKVVRTVMCYIQSLKNNDAEENLTSAIGLCDANGFDTECASVVLEQETIPNQAPLNPLPKICSDDGFEYWTGDVIPADISLATCTECPGLADGGDDNGGDNNGGDDGDGADDGGNDVAPLDCSAFREGVACSDQTMLDWAGAPACIFYVVTNGKTCTTWCNDYGMQCLKGHDNLGQCALHPASHNGCEMNHGDQICACAP